MDKKAKKRIEVLRQRVQKLHQQISGAKQQNDDEAELAKFQKELHDAEAEIEKLKSS